MKVIGFADKYYTLWEVDTEYRNNGRYTEVITHNVYIKNISFDINKVKSLYPNVEISESLRGHTKSWDSAPKRVYNDIDTFRFGKYDGQKIEEVNDIDYICWYWGQIYCDEHKDFVSEYLKKNGYEIRHASYGDYLMSPSALETEKNHDLKLNELIEKANNNIPVEIFVEYNPDEEGYILDEDGFHFKFNEVKESYYLGYSYFLPVLNGKAKRIKNKKILATIKYDEGDFFNIIDFKIIK